ncbi:MAG: flagellar protein export ATPase FliI [Firmicutes bacterium]|nr:flagellar protein export ATPase FliI [Bacillota bacterium]
MARYSQTVDRVESIQRKGRVSQIIGLSIQSDGPMAQLGELCEIATGLSLPPLLAEVVGFKNHSTLLMPLGEMEGISPGAEVTATGRSLRVKVGEQLTGRILSGLGEPMDGMGGIFTHRDYPVMNQPPNPLDRQRISTPLSLGVRAIDSMLTCGKGQRIGIFAGSGIGKSTIMGMVARYTSADVNVIGLIGERGREVREFLERDLGEEGLKRSVVVVATSDQPALVRLKGAFLATAIAEYFRDQGLDVMLMMDSITRFAMAQREVGLTLGEPPATRGYTPSVFALLPKLLERSGSSRDGTITGLYTVLVDGDDMNEPIADAVRGILDGHIVLSRELAALGHYPAIDVLKSVSRSMIEIVEHGHLTSATRLRNVLASFQEAKDLIEIGAYAAGTNPRVDYAISMIDQCQGFLRQEINERADFKESIDRLQQLFSQH